MTAVASASMPSIPTSDFPRERSRSPVKSTSTPGSPELRRKTSSASISDGIPRPPSAADLRPNAHPYPIATTATGILSRANSLSSPASGNSGKHHYVPPSPAKEQPDAYGKDGGSGGSGAGGKGGERRRAEYRGHRYSRSLSNSDDMYLPSSPAGGAQGGNGEHAGTGPRALPIPPNVSANSIAAMNAAATGSYSAYAAATSGIPPKRSGSTSPSRGRTGPRVSAVYEVEEPEEIDSEDEQEGTPSHRRRTMSVPIASPFPTSAKQSPFATRYEFSTDRQSPSPSPSPTSGRFRNGRVKGMVRSFESSGSESGSPERERSGSGFRESGSGSGFRAGRVNPSANANGNGSGFRNSGSGFRRSQSQSEDDDAMMGGTVRPQGTGGRALPVRPDAVDLGATVRGYDQATAYVPAQHANGVLGAFATSNGGAKEEEEELTVEELIAREDAAVAAAQGGMMSPSPSHAMMSPSHTGGVWRAGSKRGMVGAGMGVSPNHTGMSPNHTGGAGGARHPTGGRPLPAHPHPPHTQRMSSGGVHAWEADDGAVGSTMKWVPQSQAQGARDVDVGRVFAGGEQPEPKKDTEGIAEATSAQHERAARRAKAAEQAQQRAQREKEAEERGRARGAAVRAQLAETADLRLLVDAFKVRLEEVERKVGEMEAAFDNTSPAPATATTGAAASTTPSTSPPTTITQRLDPRRLLALFAQGPAAGSARNKRPREGRDDWVGPTTLGALPSYVLLVGLGMCAVVLKVLVRRGLGLGAGAARRGA